MQRVKPKVVVSRSTRRFAHWIEMKVKLRREQNEFAQRKQQLCEKLSKMKFE
jgi:hypothetical protein